MGLRELTVGAPRSILTAFPTNNSISRSGVMKYVRKLHMPFLFVVAVAGSASAEPPSGQMRLEKHPIENVAIAATKVVGVAQGVGSVTRAGAGAVGGVLSAPFRDSSSKGNFTGYDGSETGGFNCATAASDLQTLETERMLRAGQLQRGMKSVTPGVRASGIVYGPDADVEPVDAAQYIFEIDQRESDIRTACGACFHSTASSPRDRP